MLVKNGRIQRQNKVERKGKSRERMRMSAVESEMRIKGEDQLEEVKEATLETNVAAKRSTSVKAPCPAK